ncbi:YidH family protein [Nocardioides bruguierae]|uniref:YidH family protein n=1 Tax=Nocardioides bruguierae TaxID=2945102 RepID=UPI002342CA27|nr:DUF202 domain-containing protein [Nocardioides bruguierae]
MTSEHVRRPRWVYDQGDEPDYRFSFANERTFLAWIRTALAFIAGGVGADLLAPAGAGAAGTVLASVLVLLGVLLSGIATLRWARAERAMREGRALPGFLWVGVLPVGLVLAGVLLWAAFW